MNPDQESRAAEAKVENLETALDDAAQELDATEDQERSNQLEDEIDRINRELADARQEASEAYQRWLQSEGLSDGDADHDDDHDEEAWPLKPEKD